MLDPRRRQFMALLGGAAAAWPLAARAQQAEQVQRVGVLMVQAEDDPDAKARLAGFRQGLESLGWSEGRNIRLDTRFARGGAQVQVLAKELVVATRGDSRSHNAFGRRFAARDCHDSDRVCQHHRPCRLRLCC